MSVSVQLQGTIAVTDNLPGSIQSQKLINITFPGTILEFSQNQTIGTSPVTIVVPITPIQFCYIKNLSTTQTITLTWTPTGGAPLNVLVLQPGAIQIFMETNTTSGITSLSLTGSAAATPVEYILVVV